MSKGVWAMPWHCTQKCICVQWHHIYSVWSVFVILALPPVKRGICALSCCSWLCHLLFLLCLSSDRVDNHPIHGAHHPIAVLYGILLSHVSCYHNNGVFHLAHPWLVYSMYSVCNGSQLCGWDIQCTDMWLRYSVQEIFAPFNSEMIQKVLSFVVQCIAYIHACACIHSIWKS